MNCENQSCPLWDSHHDWILQFDNVLKNRHRPRNVECTHNSRVKENGVHMKDVYDTPDGNPAGKSLGVISESE